MFSDSFLRKCLILACSIAVVLPSVKVYSSIEVPKQVVIHERLFTFSSYYEIHSDLGFQGNIIKSKLVLRTAYQYFDQNGQLGASAYLRLFSLGSLYTWAGVLDIYDSEGNLLGLIEGAILTLLPSKFHLYNAKNELIGTAYMDRDAMGFTVSDPLHEIKTIANFRRIFVKDVTDHWVISINDPDAIDVRLLYAFGAFVLDNQNDFRIDD